jgi:hypothetical protein
MVKTAPDMKIRLSPDLRREIELAATANNRTMNAEIVMRLEQSFRAESPAASKAALDALALARASADRIKVIEDALRAVCDDRFIDPLPTKVTELFIELSKRLAGE